jgi:hypothetical protein
LSKLKKFLLGDFCDAKIKKSAQADLKVLGSLTVLIVGGLPKSKLVNKYKVVPIHYYKPFKKARGLRKQNNVYIFTSFCYTGRMVITYLGKQFFKITQGDMVIAVNPIGKDSKAKASRFGAQITLITTNHPDYNGAENTFHGDTAPFVISGPGDYEVKGIFIKGILSESTIGGKKYINTIYSLSVDDISICFLGALSEGVLSDSAREAIDTPDILFVPIGGGDMLAPSPAYKLAVSLDSKIIIPMDYDPASLKVFLKEGGDEKAVATDKLTLKRKDLEGKEGEIMVLTA